MKYFGSVSLTLVQMTMQSYEAERMVINTLKRSAVKKSEDHL